MKTLSLALLALVTLGACQQQAAPVAKTKGPLEVKAGRLVLPAVKGNPAAAYFTLINSGNHDVTLTGIHIVGVKEAMMHETSGGSMNMLESVKVPAHGLTSFAPGGKHVMAMGLDAWLIAGGTAKATVTTQDGTKVAGDFKIITAGDGAGMNM